MLREGSPPPPVTCQVSHVMRHISHVTCDMSRVTCQMLHDFFLLFFFLFFFFSFKVMKLVGGGSVINGAYPV